MGLLLMQRPLWRQLLSLNLLPVAQTRTITFKKMGKCPVEKKTEPVPDTKEVLFKSIGDRFTEAMDVAEKQPFFLAWDTRFKAYRKALREYTDKGEEENLRAKHVSTSASELTYSPLHRRVAKVVARLNERLINEEQWRFRVVIGQIGGTAFPDNSVDIGSLTVNHCKTDEQLAWLLAHEMSHILYQHSKIKSPLCDYSNRQSLRAEMIRSAIRSHQLNRSIAEFYVENFTPCTSLNQWIENIWKPALLKLRAESRKHEFEADAHATDWLDNAGYKLDGGIQCMEMTKWTYIDDGIDEEPGFRTHPTYDERIAAMRKQIQAILLRVRGAKAAAKRKKPMPSY